MEKPGRFALAFTDENEQVQEAASCRDGICVSSKRVPHKVQSINTKKNCKSGAAKGEYKSSGGGNGGLQMEKKMESKNGGCVMVYGTTSTGTNTGEMEGHGTLRQPNQCGT